MPVTLRVVTSSPPPCGGGTGWGVSFTHRTIILSNPIACSGGVNPLQSLRASSLPIKNPHPCPLPARGRETITANTRATSAEGHEGVSSPPAGEGQGGGYLQPASPSSRRSRFSTAYRHWRLDNSLPPARGRETRLHHRGAYGATTPSKYQSTPQYSPSSMMSPAATRSAPVLSLIGPANGWIEPSAIPTLAASAFATTSSGTFGL